MPSFKGMIELSEREAELAAGGQCVLVAVIFADTDGDQEIDTAILIYDCG